MICVECGRECDNPILEGSSTKECPRCCGTGIATVLDHGDPPRLAPKTCPGCSGHGRVVFIISMEDPTDGDACFLCGYDQSEADSPGTTASYSLHALEETKEAYRMVCSRCLYSETRRVVAKLRELEREGLIDHVIGFFENDPAEEHERIRQLVSQLRELRKK